MMADEEDSTSRKLPSDSYGDERPMKKARYLWQIKGKYRLKQPRGRSCAQDCNGSSSQVQSNQDCPIHRWQTHQIAKAVVDNTINKVLDGLGFMPLPHDAEDLLENIFPRYRSLGYVEDEAVLMAIQSHGLQKPCSCPHSSQEPIINRTPFHHRPPTTVISEPGPSDDVIEHDFLAEAVAVAIQKKGLGSINTQTEHG